MACPLKTPYVARHALRIPSVGSTTAEHFLKRPEVSTSRPTSLGATRDETYAVMAAAHTFTIEVGSGGVCVVNLRHAGPVRYDAVGSGFKMKRSTLSAAITLRRPQTR